MLLKCIVFLVLQFLRHHHILTVSGRFHNSNQYLIIKPQACHPRKRRHRHCECMWTCPLDVFDRQDTHAQTRHEYNSIPKWEFTYGKNDDLLDLFVGQSSNPASVVCEDYITYRGVLSIAYDHLKSIIRVAHAFFLIIGTCHLTVMTETFWLHGKYCQN